MYKLTHWRLLPVVLAAVFATSLCGAETEMPFEDGETIVFRLRWGFIVAGRATLNVHEQTTVNGVPARHFSTSIRTTGLVDKIYKVRTRLDSYVTLDGTRVLAYEKKQREGKKRAHFTVDFDWAQKTAVRTDKKTGESRPAVDLPDTVTDMIGALYRFRQLPLAEDKTYTLPVTNGKKVVHGQAEIIGRETVKVPAGKFDAYKITPRTADLGGVFEKDDDADLFLWFTADRRHMPVRVASAVMVGNFIAEAVEIRSSQE
ncbi:MAG: DUF3108 domain-containing protein [Verrucomicrobiota bacterium]